MMKKQPFKLKPMPFNSFLYVKPMRNVSSEAVIMMDNNATVKTISPHSSPIVICKVSSFLSFY